MKFYSGRWLVMILCMPAIAHADEASFVSALQNTYTACVGIDSELYELKKWPV